MNPPKEEPPSAVLNHTETLVQAPEHIDKFFEPRSVTSGLQEHLLRSRNSSQKSRAPAAETSAQTSALRQKF